MPTTETDDGSDSDAGGMAAEPTPILLPYKFYTGGRAQPLPQSVILECADDSEALTIALSLATSFDGVEAWLGYRMVLRVPPKK